MLVGHSCESVHRFKSAKKSLWVERRINFLQIWLLEVAYYKNLNARAVTRDALGEQASRVCWQLWPCLAPVKRTKLFGHNCGR